MAHTFALCDWADRVEAGEIEGDHPGAGGDWADVCPTTDPPRAAFELAEEVTDSFPRAVLQAIADRWIELSGRDLERFGHCLTMQSLGHGVGLIDDIPPSANLETPATGAINVPHVEGYGVSEGWTDDDD